MPGLLDRMRTFFAKAQQPADGAVVARVVRSYQEGKALPSPHDYRRFADEGYRQNVVIAACIWELATSAVEPPLEVGVVDTKGAFTPLPSHDLQRLLNNPQPDQDGFELIETNVTHLNVAGNSFIHKIRSARGNVVQLEMLRPDRMTVVPGAGGQILGYDYKVEGGGKPDRLPAADVIHTKLHPDPLNDWYGLSPIAVLARFGDLDTQAAEFLRGFFANGGSPTGQLKFKHKVEAADRERVKALWKAEYGDGGSSRGGIIVSDSDVDYTQIGAMPDQSGLANVFGETETRICLAFGVPPIVVGVWIGLMRSSFANYAEARKSLWDETLTPLDRRIAARLTHALAPEFGTPGLVVRFDMSKVQALQEQQDSKRKWALDAWNAQLLTRNEARLRAGEPAATADGDAYKSGGAGAGTGSPLAAALGFARASRSEQHGRVAAETRTEREYRKALRSHFSAQGKAFASHVVASLEARSK